MNANRVKLQICLFSLLLLSLMPPAIAGAVNRGLDFMVVYSNDVRGETEPCG